MAKPKRICSVDGCGNPVTTRGYCSAHYHRLMRYGNPLAGKAYKSSAERWILAHASYEGDDCLTWPFNASARRKRSMIQIKTKNIPAARYMCMIAHGAPPSPDHDAAHSCGKGHKGCLNPKHLRWATHIENLNDMIAHNTRLYGARNPFAKLTAIDVREIRALRGTMTQWDIADLYGVGQSCISLILLGKSWRHLK